MSNEQLNENVISIHQCQKESDHVWKIDSRTQYIRRCLKCRKTENVDPNLR